MTMTTVGFGDIVPNTSIEKLVCILSMILSCGVFAFIMGSIGSFVNRKDAKLQNLKDEVLKIESFMDHNKVPEEF